PRGLLDWLVRFSGSLTSVAVVLVVASLFARYRTANIEVRAQLKWLSSVFVLCGCCAAALFVVGVPLHVTTPLLWITLIAAVLAIPLSITAAIRVIHRRRSEEHTSELQSHLNLVCRLLLEKKKKQTLKTKLKYTMHN